MSIYNHYHHKSSFSSPGLAVPFVELTVTHASVLTILAISFERYYAICEPLRAGYVCTKTRATLICALVWFFAALFTRYMIIKINLKLYAKSKMVFQYSLLERTVNVVLQRILAFLLLIP